jgi:hypothetical protein
MNVNFSTLRSLASDRRTLTRASLVASTLVFIALALYFALASNTRHLSIQDESRRVGWREVTSSPTTLSVDAFVATWGAKRVSAAEQSRLEWIARDSADLRQSLLALDATRVGVQRISVTKRESDFAVTAEVMQ